MFAERSSPLFPAYGRTRAIEQWREAAQLVWTRWDAFQEAAPEARQWTFAAYVAALDAESAAAATVANLAIADAA